jgi:hypothetical protein
MLSQKPFHQEYARLGKSAAPQGRQVVNGQIQDTTRRRRANGHIDLTKTVRIRAAVNKDDPTAVSGMKKEVEDMLQGGKPGKPGVFYRYPSKSIKDTDYAPTIYTLTFVERVANRRANPPIDRTGQSDPVVFSDWQGLVYDSECEPYFAGVLEQKDHDLGANPHE